MILVQGVCVGVEDDFKKDEGGQMVNSGLKKVCLCWGKDCQVNVKFDPRIVDAGIFKDGVTFRASSKKFYTGDWGLALDAKNLTLHMLRDDKWVQIETTRTDAAAHAMPAAPPRQRAVA